MVISGMESWYLKCEIKKDYFEVWIMQSYSKNENIELEKTKT